MHISDLSRLYHGRVKRTLLVASAVLVLGGLALGGWLYTTHQQVQRTGVSVYRALVDDGMPLTPGVLDDPVFRSLPAPAVPPTLGRYVPPEKAKSGATSGVVSGPFLDPSPPRPLGQQKVHILLIGNDQRQLGSGRADTILTLTFDPAARTLYLMSIPRDTRVDIPGHGLVKINAAYAYGGASLQTSVVERFLGIPFDKYVEVSLDGFTKAINEIGGVNVTSSLNFDLDGQHIGRGALHLNGPEALVYARMRHDDPLGDLGRNQRQQQVIQALMRALGGLASTALTQVIGRLSSDVRTDFSPSEVVRLRAAHPYMLSSQKSVKVLGVNQKLSGIWYYLVSDKERQRLHLLLR
jgi:LCP family protein required for cell wall assembly